MAHAAPGGVPASESGFRHRVAQILAPVGQSTETLKMPNASTRPRHAGKALWPDGGNQRVLPAINLRHCGVRWRDSLPAIRRVMIPTGPGLAPQGLLGGPRAPRAGVLARPHRAASARPSCGRSVGEPATRSRSSPAVRSGGNLSTPPPSRGRNGRGSPAPVLRGRDDVLVSHLENDAGGSTARQCAIKAA